MSTEDNRHDLIWEIRYGMRFGRRQARLLDRAATLFKILSILAGSAAFIAVLGSHDEMIKWSGLAVAAVALIDAIWNPAGRAAKSREMEMRYAALNRDADNLTAKELKKQIADLYDAEVPELDTLRPIVYNDVVSEMGDDEKAKFHLKPWHKLLSAFA